jgi:exopolyphosphatase / guanosine-5'-triphosphate,3'-diphosphate pyrophosphatase
MRIGVFDIGTKAVRLLIGDTNNSAAISNQFSFSNYKNFGDLTFLGNAMVDGNIQIKDIVKTINTIKVFAQKGKQQFKVEKFIAIGTAVFRNAKNASIIVDIIKEQTGIEIRVISSKEEAEYSMIAAIVSSQNYLEKNDTVLLIDQGGGSTEISFATFNGANSIIFESSQSFNLGTIELLNRVFNYDATFENVYKQLLKDAEIEIKSHKSFGPKNRIKAFGLGNGIVNMTGKRGSKHQHGIELSSQKIGYIADKTIQEYSAVFEWEISPMQNHPDYPEGKKKHISDIKDHYYNRDGKRTLELPISMLLARAVYKPILDFYNIEKIRICGAGLRYGVFFSELLDFKKD